MIGCRRLGAGILGATQTVVEDYTASLSVEGLRFLSVLGLFFSINVGSEPDVSFWVFEDYLPMCWVTSQEYR